MDAFVSAAAILCSERTNIVPAWPRIRRGDTRLEPRSAMKVASASKETSRFGRRYARRLQSLLLRVRKRSALRAWGLRIANGRACCARLSRWRASLPVSCTGCGSAKTDFHVGFGAKVTQRLRLKPAQ